MSDIDATLAALKTAVQLAPDNVPLLQHYIRTLVELTRAGEAERFLTDRLASGGTSPAVQLMLADVFYRQGKNSHALAIVETLSNPASPYAPALVLHAKLLYREGRVDQAVHAYRRAVEHDEALADGDFESLLGIRRWNDADADDPEGDPEAWPDAADVVEGRVRAAVTPDDAGTASVDVERPAITFADIGGMEAVKEQIRLKIIFPLTHADMFAAYGKQAGGGILLYGPPGCGKTHLARATAGEVKAGFLAIGINDVLDMWLGNSERNLHELFARARRHRPCVMFFDEVDALGASRSDLRQSSGRHLVNQFLSELDGVKESNTGVLVLGATNAPWHVDAAFRRPGRFDRVIFVPPPDAAAREEILAIHLRGKPVADVDCRKLAAKTADFSGADLMAVVDTAVEDKLQAAIRTGRPTPLTTADLLDALRRVKPTTREWFATARNHALYANQGGAYDDILTHLKLQ